MIEVTRFRLYPNKETEDKLFSNLRICSFVYNWCLEYNIWNDSVLPQIKEVYPDVKEVHSRVLQNIVHQVRAEMVQNGNCGLSKAILDASWGKFGNYVEYKAENAGKYAVQVIAKGTTQDCSICGKTVPKDLSVRVHNCPYCGSVMPRDYNSSRNINLRGIELVGWGTPEPSLLDMGKLNTLAEIRTSILDINNPEQVFIGEAKNLPSEGVKSVKYR